MVDDIGEFVGVEPEVNGHGAAAGFEAGEHGFQHLRTVVHQQRDVVPLPHPEAAQGVGQLVGAGVEGGVVQTVGPLDDGQVGGEAGG